MDIVVRLPVTWIAVPGALLGAAGFLFGIFSAARPKRSVEFYVWFMSKFNWSVRPIDEPREIRNTRLFGILLVVLGLLTAALFLGTVLRGRPA